MRECTTHCLWCSIAPGRQIETAAIGLALKMAADDGAVVHAATSAKRLACTSVCLSVCPWNTSSNRAFTCIWQCSLVGWSDGCSASYWLRRRRQIKLHKRQVRAWFYVGSIDGWKTWGHLIVGLDFLRADHTCAWSWYNFSIAFERPALVFGQLTKSIRNNSQSLIWSIYAASMLAMIPSANLQSFIPKSKLLLFKKKI